MSGRASGMAVLVCALAAASGGCGAQSGGPIEPVAELGEGGTQPGQFSYPRAMDSDDGTLFVVDKLAWVQRFDAGSGEVLARWRMPEYKLGKPTGITLAPGPDGREALYVADTHYNRVMIYGVSDPSEPALLASFGSHGDDDGEFRFPTDVAVLAGDDGRPQRIYVSEYGGNDRISVFDASYTFLFSFGSFGSGVDQFDRPQSIAIVNGELVVADACNHRLGRFTLGGDPIAWFDGSDDAEHGPFVYPYGLAALRDGTVLVSEYGSSRVRRLDPAAGKTLAVWGGPGYEPGQLAHPWAVAAIDGTAYVLDSGHNRVLGFRIGGGL